MDISIGIGQIGDGGMAPKETSHNGKPFRRCSVWIDDPFGDIVKDEEGNDVLGYNGKPQRKRKTKQLVFGTSDAEGSLFRSLGPARKILFIGRESHRPRVAEYDGKPTRREVLTDPQSGKEYVAYENATVHVMRVEFIDPSLSLTLARYKAAAIEAGMSEEDAERFVTTVITQLSNRGNAEPPAEGGGDAPAAEGTEVPPSENGNGDDPF
jgi:hypothetical protein